MLACGWLYVHEYRGALLLEQLGIDVIAVVFSKLAPLGK